MAQIGENVKLFSDNSREALKEFCDLNILKYFRNMQHCLYNITEPVLEHEAERFNTIISEFGLNHVNIDVTKINIETERLLLRSWQETDLFAIVHKRAFQGKQPVEACY